MDLQIKPADVDDPRVRALLLVHLRGMHANSPPEHVHALDLSGLRASDITFVAAWDGETLLGFGALRALAGGQGEIKSMRTARDHLRKGVATAILDHLLGVAAARGYTRVSLETGTGDAFEPALGLYRRRGFVNGPAFGDYAATDFNQFLHLALEP